MLEHLFGSKTRLKLLRVLFREPAKSFYVRELTRLLDAQINAVRREIAVLDNAGLLVESKKKDLGSDAKAGSGLRKYYRLNTESILYPELHALLLKAQVLGEQRFVEELRAKGGKVKLLLITGRFTGDERAVTDLLIVGELKPRTISRLVEKHEKEFGFSIRYTEMSEQEFFDRRHMMDKFLYSVFEAQHMKVVDELLV